MKPIKYFSFLALLVLLIGSALNSQAQYRNNAIKMNFPGIFVGQFHFGYERAIRKKWSLQFSGGYLTGTSEGTFNGEPWWDGKRTGFIVIPEARYYAEEALKGLYAAPFFRFRQTVWDIDDVLPDDDVDFSYERTRTTIGGGAVVGYKVFISNAVFLDIFLGIQYKEVSRETDYDDPQFEDTDEPSIDISFIDNDGVGGRFGINVGFTF